MNEFFYLLRAIADPHAMPQNSKLDQIGIDLDVTTLPAWGDPHNSDAEAFAKRVARDAMWRASQTIAQGIFKEMEG